MAGIGAGTWQALRALGEPKATVDRAVQRGWVTVRQDGEGKGKVHSASLTVEGRRLAVKSRGRGNRKGAAVSLPKWTKRSSRNW